MSIQRKFKNHVKFTQNFQGLLSNEEIVKKRNAIFNAESQRQREQVGRIEKIEVRYLGVPEDTTFMMNKGISTPFNVAKRKFF